MSKCKRAETVGVRPSGSALALGFSWRFFSTAATGWLAAIVASAIALASASTAEAQAWLEDRARAQGRGIRIGDFELHPGIGTEIGYDSNVFFDDKNPQASAILRVTPHFIFSNLTAERRGEGERKGTAPSVAFQGGLSASFMHFFIDKARDNVAGTLGLDLRILPERPFTLAFTENLDRSIRPFAQNPTAVGLNYSRTTNRSGVEAQFRSRGNVLEGKLGYTFVYDYFEGSIFRSNTSMSHLGNATATWRFLPSTAIVYRGEVAGQNYTDRDNAPFSLLSSNFRISSLAGLNGAITQRFSFTGLVGYSAGFYKEQDDFDGLAAQAQLLWKPSETVQFALGYDRSYQPSFIGNFYRQDQGFLSGQVMMGGVFLMAARVTLANLQYGTAVNAAGGLLGNVPERHDIRLVGSLFSEYRVADWLGINGTLTYTGDFTDYSYALTNGVSSIVDPAKFNKFEAWLGLRAFY